MGWHIVRMDGYVAGPTRTRAEAVDYCRRLALDDRKRPTVRRRGKGAYIYTGPVQHLHGVPTRRVYEIVNDERLRSEHWPLEKEGNF